MVRSWSVTARGLASVQVVGRNWIVALGRGLEELGRADSLMRLACEVLPNGTVIARDITSGTGYIVQAIGEVDLRQTPPTTEGGYSELSGHLQQLADDPTMEFALGGEDTPAQAGQHEADDPQEEVERIDANPLESIALDPSGTDSVEPIGAESASQDSEPGPIPLEALPGAEKDLQAEPLEPESAPESPASRPAAEATEAPSNKTLPHGPLHSASEHSVSEHSASEHSVSEHSVSEHSASEHSASEHSASEPPPLAIVQVAAVMPGLPEPIPLDLGASSGAVSATPGPTDSSWVTPPTEERVNSHRPAPMARESAPPAEPQAAENREPPQSSQEGRQAEPVAEPKDATEAEETDAESIFELPEDAIREIGPAEDPGWPILHAETVLQACERALGAARAASGAESGAVILAERGYLRFVAVSGPHATRLMGTRLPLGTGVAGFALERRRTVVLADAHADPRHCGEVDALTGYVTREIAVLPLVLDGVGLGVLELMNLPDGRRFTKADMDVLQPLADALAIRIGR